MRLRVIFGLQALAISVILLVVACEDSATTPRAYFSIPDQTPSPQAQQSAQTSENPPET